MFSAAHSLSRQGGVDRKAKVRANAPQCPGARCEVGLCRMKTQLREVCIPQSASQMRKCCVQHCREGGYRCRWCWVKMAQSLRAPTALPEVPRLIPINHLAHNRNPVPSYGVSKDNDRVLTEIE